MKIFQINATCGVGSTGKIVVSISELMTQGNIDNRILYSTVSNGYPLGIPCGKNKNLKFQALKSRILGNYGFNSKSETRKIINELEKYQPDVVSLHNIHGHDCNLQLLFSYFKHKQTKLYWTFHDCWAFTGYCTHFTAAKCEKWKTGCIDCPQKRQFSWILNRSHELYNKKKALFSGIDMTIITPSQWLADLVKQSFLKDYPVKVINNGIDLTVFKPTHSDFRERNNISDDKFILLGVAFGWGERKGLDVFVELANRLDSSKYQIVLVGTDDAADRFLPKSIISIHRTQNQKELAEIYTAADLFVNPTREENYPTVNMEAIACGIPVLTFRTGGSPEIPDETCGSVVDYNDVTALENEIVRICETMPFSKEACLERAKSFDINERFKEYVDLYNKSTCE